MSGKCSHLCTEACSCPCASKQLNKEDPSGQQHTEDQPGQQDPFSESLPVPPSVSARSCERPAGVCKPDASMGGGEYTNTALNCERLSLFWRSGYTVLLLPVQQHAADRTRSSAQRLPQWISPGRSWRITASLQRERLSPRSAGGPATTRDWAEYLRSCASSRSRDTGWADAAGLPDPPPEG